jgi:hypothetical protein
MMSPDRQFRVSLLFGQYKDPFLVRDMFRIAAGLGGAGQLSGRRTRTSPLSAAIGIIGLRFWVAIVGVVAILTLPLLGDEAHAEQALSVTHRASGRSNDPFAAFVTEASKRFGVPEHWIRAMLRVESGGKLRARSQKGAMGLMQIMPKTWTELRVRHGLGADPYDPRNNILAGVAYIRDLHDRYGSPGFLAAYNAGPGRYEHHLATGRPLPDETQAYVAMLEPMIDRKPTSGKMTVAAKSFTRVGSPLFVMQTASSPTVGRLASGVRADGPLSIRAAADLSALVPQSRRLFVRWSRSGNDHDPDCTSSRSVGKQSKL